MRYTNVTNGFSVASLAAPKLDLYSIRNNDKIIHVYDAYLISLLSHVFRVPYKILFPHDGEYGVILPDGNWTGIIDMVRRSEVDLAVGGIILSDTRFQAVNFSYPYQFSDYTFMTDKQKPSTTSFVLLQPFSKIFWILLIAVTLLFSGMLFLHLYRKQKYHNILFMLFGSLLEKPIGMQFRKLSLKLIISAWLVFTFVITNSYKAVLLSILTSPTLTGIKNITDLAEAANENSIACYSYKGGNLQKMLLESDFDTWRSIGKCVQRNVGTFEDAEEAFVKATSKKAFLSDRCSLTPYKEKFFISEDTLSNSMRAFPVSKKFCCLKYLNKVIHRLFAAGVFQKIEKDELERKATKYDPNEYGKFKALQLEDLKGAFIVLLSGYALSTIVLFIEITVNHYFPKANVNLIKKRRKCVKKFKINYSETDCDMINSP